MICARRTAQALESTHGPPVGPASALSFLVDSRTLGQTPSRSAIPSGGRLGSSLTNGRSPRGNGGGASPARQLKGVPFSSSNLEASFHSAGHRNGISSGIVVRPSLQI